jgi:endothelin-converting enzyme/putative endopeptidase
MTGIAGSLALGLLLASTGTAVAVEQHPLSELPYTPGLDTSAMDRSADPCEDFFQYSCGGWIEKNPIPPDRASWDVFSKVAEDNQRYLWGLLERASDPTVERSPTQQKIGDYFAACMATDRIEARGIAPLEPGLQAIARLASRRDLAPLVARLHESRSNGDLLFGYTSLQDFDDSQRFIGTLFSGGVGLPDRDHYLSGDSKMRETRRRYGQHVARMFELLGDPEPDARRAARRVVAFEKRLARSTLPLVDRRDETNLNHPMAASDLQGLAPGFDWQAYVQARSPATLDRVNVTEPAFAREVGRLVERTAIQDLKEYLRWSYLRGHARMLPAAIAGESFAFNSRYLHGIEQEPPRWRTCVSNADEDLGEALGQEFVDRTFPAETRGRAVAMIKIVQSVMRQRIEQLDWMGPATKEKALAKLEAMRNKVGHPEKWRDYGPLSIARDDYFGNRVRAAAFEEARLLARIGRPVDPDEWSMTPQTVNAYYDPQQNDMNFPAGVLQPPLLDPSIDAAPGWGNTGATMAHELIHGFDDSGRRFDAQGNLVDWWTPEDAAQFQQRAQCLADQYGNYTVVDDIRINSKLTLGEDIADLAGATLAFLGWKVATEDRALEPRDGLTPEQRFFVGNAQWACGGYTEESLRVSALTDVHSPLKHRVNGVFVNMPEFAEAFQCKAGQGMVKPKSAVCRIW